MKALSLFNQIPRFYFNRVHSGRNFFATSIKHLESGGVAFPSSFNLKEEIFRFSKEIGVEEAVTPPSTWFTHPNFYQLDRQTVFKNNWIYVGRTEQVSKPGEYIAGHISGEPYIVVRDESGNLNAFFNVCRHHAMAIVNEESGSVSCLQCPYHGWTYSLSGRLTKATRLKGIANFKAKNFGLFPMRVETWGPLLFVKVNSAVDDVSLFSEMSSLKASLDENCFTSGLKFITRKKYHLNCNWKVFCDNYLDGGYHVEIAHKNLSTALALDSYHTEVKESHSIQTAICTTGDSMRVSGKVTYAFIFPNLMLNRYGPWLDINLVMPITHNQCEVIFDYFLEESAIKKLSKEELEKMMTSDLKASDQVQQEDIFLCEGVQRGLESSAYDVGRYAPRVELADHAFHVRLLKEYKKKFN